MCPSLCGTAACIMVRKSSVQADDIPGCQNLRYTVMDLETFDVLQDGRVPLPRKVTLTWLGWSAVGVSQIRIE